MQISSLIFMPGNVEDSKAGLAISQSLILIGCLQYGIKQSTETMSLMTSVERILQYTNLPKETPITSNNPPPPTWPSEGQLILKNVNMKYHEDDPPVLKVGKLTVYSCGHLLYFFMLSHFADSERVHRAWLESWGGGTNWRWQVLPDLGAFPIVQRRSGGRDQDRR